MPMRNHWWNVTLYPRRGAYDAPHAGAPTTSRSSSTSSTTGSWVRTTTRTQLRAARRSLGRRLPRAVHGMLDGSMPRRHRAVPFGVPRQPRFADDRDHASYDTDAAARFSDPAVERRRPRGVRRLVLRQDQPRAPVLARLRPRMTFSGKRADARPGVDAVTAEAYSHEVISFGFWAGDTKIHSPPTTLIPHPNPRELPKNGPSGRLEASWTGQANGSRDPPPRRLSAALATRRRRCSTSFRAPTKQAHPSPAGTRRHCHAAAPRPVDRLTHCLRALGLTTAQQGDHHMSIVDVGRGSIGPTSPHSGQPPATTSPCSAATAAAPATQTPTRRRPRYCHRRRAARGRRASAGKDRHPRQLHLR